ncbi:hypothetical protein AMAG_01317 [Allomyces macrogynus ATCC 38327]|uniref:Uncharacterized protein n=1 Tax=Allomyces macrogynus (strain ATCC 38327) TaxID=578462 RepID=A0A0L0RZ49_ALLM3|nr:hypothetical protein AMAG_01317 [Allomyces macrogynus ATCC 38327]|eukprot:KNE55420.1 hypothetical protein AMAG_01317 [Allomyces macrogynus ATCC 38327]
MVDVGPTASRTTSNPAMPRRGSGMVTTETTTTTTTAGTTGATGGTSSLSREEAIRELEALRRRGYYRGPGVERADRAEVERVEQYVKEDAPVVEEHVRTKQYHEIIPTVKREREVAEIRHAVLPIREKAREDTVVTERVLPELRQEDYRLGIRHAACEEERRRNREISERLSRGYHEELPTEHEYRYSKPRVEEVVRPRIIHEVHPVVQREIDRERIEREYLPVRERIIEGVRVSEDIEVLKPMTRDEWERSHGLAHYQAAGWRQDDEFLRRERIFDDLYGGRPLEPRRTASGLAPGATTTTERRYIDEPLPRLTLYIDEPRRYADEPRRYADEPLRRYADEPLRRYADEPRASYAREPPITSYRSGEPVYSRGVGEPRGGLTRAADTLLGRERYAPAPGYASRGPDVPLTRGGSESYSRYDDRYSGYGGGPYRGLTESRGYGQPGDLRPGSAFR